MNAGLSQRQAFTPQNIKISIGLCYSPRASAHTSSYLRGRIIRHHCSHTKRNHAQTNSSVRQFATSPTRQLRKGANLPVDGAAVRTRFAPSPTGYLHIGGLRTALFSFLLAKRCGGQFVLRIEDTDQKRLISDAEKRIFEDLQWAGVRWDEGPVVKGPYGPYRQSDRTQIYQQHARELLDQGKAYRCFCTPQLAGEAQVQFVTSGCYQSCSSLSIDESTEQAETYSKAFTIRLHVPPNADKLVYPDLVYKRIQRLKRTPGTPLSPDDEEGLSAADTILMKSDGTPTYHFANVVDDHLMRITHVIRGDEWMASTPLHFDIYRAFGWEPPKFAHVGLLVDANGAKLSKRNAEMGMDVRSMHDLGVLPAALNNFLVLQGWSNPVKSDVMDMADLIKNFDLKFTTGNSTVQMEKLWFLQKQHFANLSRLALSERQIEPIQDVLQRVVNEVQRLYPTFDPPVVHQLLQHDNAENQSTISPTSSARLENQASVERYCTEILLADSKSYSTATEYVKRNSYFFTCPPQSNQSPEPGAAESKALVDEHAMLHAITRGILDGANYVEAYNVAENTSAIVSSSTITPELRHMQKQERKIHAVQVQQVWAAALSKLMQTMEAGASISKELPHIPLLETAPAPGDFASKLLQQISANGQEVSDEDIAALVQNYKAINSTLMRYLRQRLCGGQPGPGMSITMAILGHAECCARLGVDPATSSGWEIMI